MIITRKFQVLPSLKLTYPLKIDSFSKGDSYWKPSFLGVNSLLVSGRGYLSYQRGNPPTLPTFWPKSCGLVWIILQISSSGRGFVAGNDVPFYGLTGWSQAEGLAGEQGCRTTTQGFLKVKPLLRVKKPPYWSQKSYSFFSKTSRFPLYTLGVIIFSFRIWRIFFLLSDGLKISIRIRQLTKVTIQKPWEKGV